MKQISKLMAFASLALVSCQSNGVKVTVSNNSDSDCNSAIVELWADSVLSRLGSKYCYVTDSNGNEVASQHTHDGKIIFRTSIGKGSSEEYQLLPSDTLHTYPQLTAGRLYPERADDMAWENEMNGYRVYGPATQAKGERGFGYDLFFKHKTDDLILEKLYGPETDPATWQKVDSLQKIDPELANKFRDSISYHIDHGLGMDCYAVGPTLGAGVAAILRNDTIFYPWCYEKAEVLDNGPLRFTARLDFAPVRIAGDTAVVEHRPISLDAGSYLNNTEVWYDGLSGNADVVVGFPLRDDSPSFISEGIIAYSDPTQGPDNGRAQLGIIIDNDFTAKSDKNRHVLGIVNISPSDTLSYRWGFSWDREDIKDMESWIQYLKGQKRQNLEVEY